MQIATKVPANSHVFSFLSYEVPLFFEQIYPSSILQQKCREGNGKLQFLGDFFGNFIYSRPCCDRYL